MTCFISKLFVCTLGVVAWESLLAKCNWKKLYKDPFGEFQDLGHNKRK